MRLAASPGRFEVARTDVTAGETALTSQGRRDAGFCPDLETGRAFSSQWYPLADRDTSALLPELARVATRQSGVAPVRRGFLFLG